jgi:iron(III) transport system permease protein
MRLLRWLCNRIALPTALLCLIAAWWLADSIERDLLANTAWLVLSVGALALPLSTVLAFVLVRTNMAAKRLGLVLVSSVLFIPLYLQLCGWEAAFGRQGWHTFAFQTLDDPWLSGWRGAVFVHAVFAIPWATCLMAAAFSQGDREQEEAALLDGSAGQVLFGVTLPQLTGGVLLAAIWIFVVTAGEMTVTNIYLVPTYAEDVYNFYAGNADVRANSVHYLPLLLCTAALVLCLQSALPSPALSMQQNCYTWRLGSLRWLATGFVLAVLSLLVTLPIGNLFERLGEEVRRNGTQLVRGWSAQKGLRLLVATPQNFAQEFVNTVEVALAAVLLSLSISLWWSWLSRRRPIPAAIGWMLSVIGLALPGPIIGLGIITILNHDLPLLEFLYDRTLLPPILAILVRVVPCTFIILWWALSTLDDQPLDAAALDGASSWRRLFSIALPQRWPLLIAAALMAFVISSGDVSASLLVLPPGPLETIGRRMFGLIHVGADDQVAGVAIVCWASYLMIAAVVMLAFARGHGDGRLAKTQP